VPISPDPPFPKTQGDNIRSKDWNDVVKEVQRLDTAKLAAVDYAFANSVAADVVFSQLNANGATQIVTTTFRPKFVWVTGSVSATLAGLQFGVPVSGYADVRASIIQRCSGAEIRRITTAPFWHLIPTSSVAVCFGRLADVTITPNRVENVAVTISSVTATGLVLTLSRNVPSTSTVTFAPLTQLNITLRLLCLG
jgi:hypothetical protein